MPQEFNRIAEVTTPLGDDVLLFQRMTATEEIGRPFHFDLELLSEDAEISLEDVLGQPMTVKLFTREEGERFFHGLVSRFAKVGSDGRHTKYRAVLRPWLWFLTRTADCRIYQEKTVVEVIKDVFERHGFTDLEDTLSGTYRTWVNCVQYRETDYNFVCRLMEQEGIYFYFKHEEPKHTLVLADGIGGHEPADGYAEVPFAPPAATKANDENLHTLSVTQEVQSCNYALNDFDFEKPKADLKVLKNISRGHAMADFEIYDYPGEYVVAADGDSYAGRRIEELQAGYERVRGAGTIRGISVGALFTLTGHPWESENREYLVLSSTHEIQVEAYRSTASGRSGSSCTVAFVAMDSQSPYRSGRITPKPIVQGPQTAIVVGKKGEEIWTDKYGRVKVQFHWDRYGKSDENSSCWVRVSQYWAGKTWGGIHLPRIGQEVIVEFLEGDPDRPIVTGRVYNADNMPPYPLPANQTQSGIKSRSTKEGTGENFNEIRMEDKKGEEQLYIHAEKDKAVTVENDNAENVGHDETIEVGNDRTLTVGKNEQTEIGKDRTEKVAENETITIGKDRKETVGGKETIAIAKKRTTEIGEDESLTVGKGRTTTVGKSDAVEVSDDYDLSAGKNGTIKIGKKMTIEVADELKIKVGDASMTLKSDGKIEIKGADLNLKASGKINAKASSDVIIKGSKVAIN